MNIYAAVILSAFLLAATQNLLLFTFHREGQDTSRAFKALINLGMAICLLLLYLVYQAHIIITHLGAH